LPAQRFVEKISFDVHDKARSRQFESARELSERDDCIVSSDLRLIVKRREARIYFVFAQISVTRSATPRLGITKSVAALEFARD
jgi:hypothetical protein